MEVNPGDLRRSLERAVGEAARGHGGLLTAFSGGVDSTLVAVVARLELGRAAAPAGIGVSASLAADELAAARALAERFDFELVEVDPGEQRSAAYLANNPDRCYHCKTHLYAALAPIAAARGLRLANGTNADDLGEVRPGLRAAAEAQVASPLLDARLGKAAVRTLARELGLPNADKPAAPCLASRLPHGTPVTLGRLQRVEEAETALRALGLRVFRVRDHAPLARVEVADDELALCLGLGCNLRSAVQAAGYAEVEVVGGLVRG